MPDSGVLSYGKRVNFLTARKWIDCTGEAFGRIISTDKERRSIRVEGLEMICFQIISSVGTARSSYIEAIQKAKTGDFEGAKDCIAAGQQEFLKGHEAHFELLQKETKGEAVGGSLLLIHAEDQLMSAEGFKIIAEEMIANYQRIDALEKKLAR